MGALALGLIAAIGESAADLLQPWPLKIVLDNVLQGKNAGGWLNHLIHQVAGTDKAAALEFACLAVLGIAVFDAVCSYGEK